MFDNEKIQRMTTLLEKMPEGTLITITFII